MKKLMVLSVMTSALMAPVLSSAAPVDLKLIGTITPAACVPNFTGGSTIDYGNIPAGSLNADAQTALPTKTTKFSVVCNAPIKFGFITTDERSASASSNITLSGGRFGLGLADNNEKIGAYSMSISNETPDTGVARRLASSDNGATWSSFGGALYNGSRLVGFGNSATATTPSAHTSIVVDIEVAAYIDKTSILPITNDIAIDGLTTFEVKYL